MSTIIMSACWPLQGMTPAQKAVLVSLADMANDDGVCWPSVAHLSMRTCLSERAVQSAIKWLASVGAVGIKGRTGRSTVYRVTPAAYAPPQELHPRTSNTPEDNAPPQQMRGAGNAPTPADAAPTPAASAPRTVKNHQRTNNPPNPPAAPGGGKSVCEKNRVRQERVSLKTFAQRCAELGEKPISDYQPLLDYVRQAGLPMEFVQIAWEVFKGEHMPGGTNAGRLKADWRRHFTNYVTKGYYRLWYAKDVGGDTPEYSLTTQGLQAKTTIEARRREAA